MMNVYCWRTGSISAVTSVEDSTRHLPYCPSLTALHPNAVSRPILRVWFLDPARRMSSKCLCLCNSARHGCGRQRVCCPCWLGRGGSDEEDAMDLS